MKKMIFKTVLPLGILMLAGACSAPRKDLLQAEFEGVGNETVYLTAIPLSRTDSVLYDTIALEDGAFVWNVELASPTDVLLELGRDRRPSGRRAPAASDAYRVNFLLQPGEKVRIKAVYEDDFLSYELSGSRELELQSDLRARSREEYVTSGLLHAKIAQALAGGVENADEAYVDSLYEVFGQVNARKANAALPYVKAHPKQMLSAWFLMKHPDRDTFLNYLPVLDVSVVEGPMAGRLQQIRQYAEHMRLLRENAEKLSPGATAPDFTLLDLEGKPVRLSDFSEKHVVLDFWGTWCPWCVKGIPQMKRYHAKLKDKVVFLGIACRDKEEKVKAMVGKEGMKWVNVMNGDSGNDVASLYGVSGYPTKILLEPGLKVKGRYLGEVPEFYQDLDEIR